jgi:hypothetical protein
VRRLTPEELRIELTHIGEDAAYIEAVVETVSSGLMGAFIEDGEIYYV